MNASTPERMRAASLQERLGIMVQASGEGYAIVDYDSLEKLVPVRVEEPAGEPEAFDANNELVRTLTDDEAHHRYVTCCWWGKGSPDCVRLPAFRLATPHGHMDFCAEHIGYAVTSLPSEWLDGFAYREPITIGENDDIPF